MAPAMSEVTKLLAQIREGNQEATGRLAPLVYAELRKIAGSLMRQERPGHTLQATALVHEAYLRMDGGASAPVNRSHFFGVAANSMRQVLLDYARRRSAAKRGGAAARRVDIDAKLLVAENTLEDVIAVDEALKRLTAIDPRQSRLIELRFFAGLSVEEVAEVLGVSVITVKREWKSAKAWLHRELGPTKSG